MTAKTAAEIRTARLHAADCARLVRAYGDSLPRTQHHINAIDDLVDAQINVRAAIRRANREVA